MILLAMLKKESLLNLIFTPFLYLLSPTGGIGKIIQTTRNSEEEQGPCGSSDGRGQKPGREHWESSVEAHGPSDGCEN